MNNYFMETHHHEWLLTNKLGGYALGTGNLINQRKYHGLLIAGTEKMESFHLVAGIEEKVEWRGEIIHLDSNNYSNCIYPEGFLYLVKPWLLPYPIFIYSALPHQDEILIRKEIMMDETTNTVLIKYSNLGHHKLHLELHPKYTMHNHHEVNHPGSLDNENFDTEIINDEKACSFSAVRPANYTRLYGCAPGSEVFENRFVYYNVFYPWDAMKGYPGVGDQLTLFEIRMDLEVGEDKYILFSDQPMEAIEEKIANILKRYESLPLPHDYPVSPDNDDTLLNSLDFEDNNLFHYNEYIRILVQALHDFILDDDVISGYPWYSYNSADTMFFLNSILSNPSMAETVKKIAEKYLRNLRDGFLALNINELLSDINPISLEAGLELVNVLSKLSEIDQENALVQQNITTIEQILNAIKNNKTFPFRLRDDGLIALEKEYAHNTWMNLLLDNKPVTSRQGAPVELNAMWYNAICVYEHMCTEFNKTSKTNHEADKALLDIRNSIASSFQKYWVKDYLADRLIENDTVNEIRPNALIAASLTYSPLSSEQLKNIFDKAFNALFTFYGIRSLHPSDSKFRKKYYGNQTERDLAFHNGSVWAWLLGPYCELFLKVHKDKIPDDDLIKQVTDYIGSFRKGFVKGHIASIAEIWDGDAPHFPKGSPAFARSVAAIYKVEMLIQSIGGEKR